jgi:hypothetical protein
MKFFIFLFGREAPVLGWLDKFKGAPLLVPSFCIQYSAVSHHASKPFGIQHRHLELAFYNQLLASVFGSIPKLLLRFVTLKTDSSCLFVICYPSLNCFLLFVLLGLTLSPSFVVLLKSTSFVRHTLFAFGT